MSVVPSEEMTRMRWLSELSAEAKNQPKTTIQSDLAWLEAVVLILKKEMETRNAQPDDSELLDWFASDTSHNLEWLHDEWLACSDTDILGRGATVREVLIAAMNKERKT